MAEEEETPRLCATPAAAHLSFLRRLAIPDILSGIVGLLLDMPSRDPGAVGANAMPPGDYPKRIVEPCPPALMFEVKTGKSWAECR